VDNPTTTVCCCREADSGYCSRCDILLGLEGVHVIDVARTAEGLRVTVETPPHLEGCRRCGVVAHGHGRRDRVLHDIPCFGAPVTLIWRKRTYVCPRPPTVACVTWAFAGQGAA